MNINKLMLDQLAAMYGADMSWSNEQKQGRIEKGVYKYTTCGCCIGFQDNGVTVSGYCEGSDAELPGHDLTWPFAEEQFWQALDDADQDGITEWNDTHGCDACRETFQIEDECEPCPIDPYCPECDGMGVVI